MALGTKIKEVAARLRSRAGVTLYCSFCGKSQHKVAKLIAGPSVFICDECVGICHDILSEEPQGATGRDLTRSKSWKRCRPRSSCIC